jgi:hypothetical protein
MEKQIIENFVQSYLATAQWVTVDGTTRGFTKAAKKIAESDCLKFIELVKLNFYENEVEKILTYQGSDVSCLAGHDFFLTRNGHGAGFWDKDIYDELAPNGCNRLTQIAKMCGSADVYQNRGYLSF